MVPAVQELTSSAGPMRTDLGDADLPPLDPATAFSQSPPESPSSPVSTDDDWWKKDDTTREEENDAAAAADRTADAGAAIFGGSDAGDDSESAEMEIARTVYYKKSSILFRNRSNTDKTPVQLVSRDGKMSIGFQNGGTDDADSEAEDNLPMGSVVVFSSPLEGPGEDRRRRRLQIQFAGQLMPHQRLDALICRPSQVICCLTGSFRRFCCLDQPLRARGLSRIV